MVRYSGMGGDREYENGRIRQRKETVNAIIIYYPSF